MQNLFNSQIIIYLQIKVTYSYMLIAYHKDITVSDLFSKVFSTHDRGMGRHSLKQRGIAEYIAIEIRCGHRQPSQYLNVQHKKYRAND